jgi:hypothetical protein
MKIFQLCVAKSGYICNSEAYHGVYPRDVEHKIFSAINRLCKPVQNKGYMVDMERWFSGDRALDLRETGWGGMDWIDLAQDRDQWRVLVNIKINFRVP